jgi:hypothetical protein
MRRVFILFICLVLQTLFSIAIAGEFRYDSHGKRDPFLIASKARTIIAEDDGMMTHLKLEGVVVDPKGNSIAIVNGEMLKEGDQIGESIVVKRITSQGVEFDNDGKSFNVPIVTKDE